MDKSTWLIFAGAVVFVFWMASKVNAIQDQPQPQQ